eukprot:jgi/Pico_ML_1/53074/g3688.t1
MVTFNRLNFVSPESISPFLQLGSSAFAGSSFSLDLSSSVLPGASLCWCNVVVGWGPPFAQGSGAATDATSTLDAS